MLGCKVALEQNLSIGAIFRRNDYLDVPVILSTGPNGMYLHVWVLDLPGRYLQPLFMITLECVQLYLFMAVVRVLYGMNQNWY